MIIANVKYIINGIIIGCLVAVIVSILSTTIIFASDMINNVTHTTQVAIFSVITLLSVSKSICWIGVYKFSIEQAICFFIFFILFYFMVVLLLINYEFFGVSLSFGFSNKFGLKEVISILFVFSLLFSCAIRCNDFCKIVLSIKLKIPFTQTKGE